jgi:Kef-type K+ transport system membrane component KefB
METVDLARLLLDLLVVVAGAKLAAEGAERIGVPAVLGEIVFGVLIGPSVLGLVELPGERGVSLGMLAELGVLLLLVQVGMEMDLAELGRVGRASMLVAVVGVAVPFVAGAGAGVGLGFDTETAVFVGAALTATSVGITARVFGDLRALATTEARIVLGAAVADDVLGLIILTVVVKVVTGDSVTVGVVAATALIAMAFLVASGVVGVLVVPRLLRAIDRGSRSGATLTAAALVIVLGLAVIADVAQLAFIIGAFMAGLAIGRSEQQERIAADLGSLGGVLIPVFFVLIGVNADLGAMFRPSVVVDAAVLLAIAIAGKLVSAYGATGMRVDRLLVGIGMIPRGEVGLIFASIGLAQGVLDDELYGALLLVVLVTTVITPPLLRWRIGATARAVVVDDDDVTGRPDDGWVVQTDGEIRLVGRPPSAAIVAVALDAAALAGNARPGSDVLDWFGERRDVPVVWTAPDTAGLLTVVRRGSVRAVRFLEVTGVLERGVPTVAAALARRRADPAELDPGRVLRFPVVARLEELLVDGGATSVTGRVAKDDVATAAALVLDVLGLDPDDAAVSRWLGELQLDVRAPVEVVLRLARQLRGAASDLEGYDRAELLQLASAIGSPRLLEPAYLLAVVSSRDDEQRDRLDQLADLLAHPDMLAEDTTLADARRPRAEELAVEPAAVARLRAAPPGYLLAHEPGELARQARLVEPLPPRGTIRVAVSPEGTPDHWLVDAAARDTDGLLARLAGALTAAGCDIAAATVGTWPDGAAVDTFLVRAAVRPSARRLAERMEQSLGEPLHLQALDDLVVQFDNDAAPWHTMCTVTGRDRPGTLAALAAAFAATGVVVHSARVTTIQGGLVDRFAIGDRVGRKLDERMRERAMAAIRGAAPRRSRRSLGR